MNSGNDIDGLGRPNWRARLWKALLIASAALVIILSALDVFLRSYDEVSEGERAQGIRTRIGTFSSARPIGTFPLSLIWALKQWPDSAACLAETAKQTLQWEALSSRVSIEVCLSRVLNNISSDDEIAATLTANGFTGVVISPASTGPTGTRSTVSATCLATARPCGVVVDELLSFPGSSYAIQVRISRFSNGMKDVRAIQLSK